MVPTSKLVLGGTKKKERKRERRGEGERDEERASDGHLTSCPGQYAWREGRREWDVLIGPPDGRCLRREIPSGW